MSSDGDAYETRAVDDAAAPEDATAPEDASEAVEDAAAPEDAAAATLPDAEFSEWLHERLRDVPGRDAYPEVFDEACAAILRWRRRFEPALWRRLMKERLPRSSSRSRP